MGWLTARLYDSVTYPIEKRGLEEWRAELLAGLEGRVLEIGAGTGRNVALYPATVSRLILAEPDAAMRKRLERKVGVTPRSCGQISVIDASAEYLPFPDARFDAVVSTLVLCSVEDPDAAAAEIHRVLKPGGVVRVIEHVAAEDARSLHRQQRIEPVWRRLAGNCHLTRDAASLLAEAGFDVGGVSVRGLPMAPSSFRRAVVGSGVKAPG